MNVAASRVLRAAPLDHVSLQTQISAAIADGFNVPGPVAVGTDGWMVAVYSRNAGQTEYDEDGAIDPTVGTAVLTKGSAAAMTLAAPTAAQAGMKLRIVAGSAFAHVVTATDLLDDGVTGGAKDTATFGAFVGSTLDLEAYNLKWVVASKNVVTIAGA